MTVAAPRSLLSTAWGLEAASALRGSPVNPAASPTASVTASPAMNPSTGPDTEPPGTPFRRPAAEPAAIAAVTAGKLKRQRSIREGVGSWCPAATIATAIAFASP